MVEKRTAEEMKKATPIQLKSGWLRDLPMDGHML